jgi:hypothetical protein
MQNCGSRAAWVMLLTFRYRIRACTCRAASTCTSSYCTHRWLTGTHNACARDGSATVQACSHTLHRSVCRSVCSVVHLSPNCFRMCASSLSTRFCSASLVVPDADRDRHAGFGVSVASCIASSAQRRFGLQRLQPVWTRCCGGCLTVPDVGDEDGETARRRHRARQDTEDGQGEQTTEHREDNAAQRKLDCTRETMS